MARYNSSSGSTSINGTATISSPFQGAFTNLTGTAPYTVTLPNPALFPGSNQTFYNATAGTVTLSTPSGVFSGTGASGTGTNSIFTGNVLSVTSDGTNYVVISEDGSPLIATTGSFSSDVTITGASATVNIQPSSLTLYPGATGAMDRVAIGVNTRSTGAFTTVAANGQVSLTANTASTTTGTGTLVVTGGIGVSGNIWSGATVNASSVVATGLTGTIQTAAQANITSTGDLTVPSLSVTNNMAIGTATASFATIDTYTQRGIEIVGSKESGTAPVIRLRETGSGLGAFEIRSNRQGATSGNYLAFGEGTSTFMVLRGDDDGGSTGTRGFVGIGSTSPTEKFQITGIGASGSTQGPRINLQYTGTSGGAESLVNFLDFRGNVNSAIGNNLDDDSVSTYAARLVFKTAVGGTLYERMRISAGGNVGIGYTGTAANKLDVRGTLGIGTASSATDNAFTFSSVNNSANNHTHTFQGPAAGTNDDLIFNLSRSGGAYGSFAVTFIGSTRLYIAGNSLSNSGHAYIAPVANLGVGYTTPSEKLSVNGNITAGNTGHEYRVRGRNQPRLIYTVSPTGAMYSTQAFVWSTLFDTLQSTTSHFDSGMAYMLYLTSSNGVHAYSWKADLRVGGTAYGAVSNRYRVSNMTEVLPPWAGGCGPSAFSAIDNSGFTYLFNPCYESVYISIIEYA
jgi:hypothetical protein